MFSGIRFGRLFGSPAAQQAICLCDRVFQSFISTKDSVLLYTIASEFAAAKPEVAGPGTFLSAFIDEIHRLSQGEREWIANAKISVWNRSNS
jgi:hydroxyethylthiazole kinase-like sugar kinase family protein